MKTQQFHGFVQKLWKPQIIQNNFISQGELNKGLLKISNIEIESGSSQHDMILFIRLGVLRRTSSST